MNATPVLSEVARAIQTAKMDVVLIGNAAAALQGAPVTTVDFDFLFRKSPRTLGQLKIVAQRLRATVLRPYYPVSSLYRVVRDEDGLQVDFMATIHGVRSFEGVRDRATLIDMGAPLRVASLTDIIKSKRAAGRPRDLAVLEVLERAQEESAAAASRPQGTRARKPRQSR